MAADFDYVQTLDRRKEETMRRDDALDDARIVESHTRVQVRRGEADGAISLSDLLLNVANEVRPQVLPIIRITEEGNPQLLRPVVLEGSTESAAKQS